MKLVATSSQLSEEAGVRIGETALQTTGGEQKGSRKKAQVMLTDSACRYLEMP